MDGNEFAADQLRQKVEGLELKVKDLEGKVPKPKPPLPVWVVLVIGLLGGVVLSKVC